MRHRVEYHFKIKVCPIDGTHQTFLALENRGTSIEQEAAMKDQEAAMKDQEAAMKDQAIVKDQDAAVKDQGTSTTQDEAEPKTESLSSKISNLPVLNGSLQTVSKTCKDIKESNAYVKYGLDVAGSSLDKAMKAGKSVLDSSTLAPVTTKAIENSKAFIKRE